MYPVAIDHCYKKLLCVTREGEKERAKRAAREVKGKKVKKINSKRKNHGISILWEKINFFLVRWKNKNKNKKKREKSKRSLLFIDVAQMLKTQVIYLLIKL